jgi:anti-sigma factor RsiW
MTCANLELALCDYLDGTLTAAEMADVEGHLSVCSACAQLASDARAALAFMERVADVEAPPELVTRMFAIPGTPEARLAVRTGIRGWIHNLLQPMLQPRMVMGLSLTILFFGMMARCAGIPERKLSAGDLDPARVWTGVEDRVQRGWERSVKFYENLRFVYQIQSRLREWREQQQDSTAPPETAAAVSDERRLSVPGASQHKDPVQPGAGATPSK